MTAIAISAPSRRAPAGRRGTLLAIGHGCVDFNQGVVPALVAILVAQRGYDYAAGAGIVLAATLVSSVAQPLFGALTDRRSLPWLLPVSVLCAGGGIAASGLGGGYPATALAVGLSGLGVAAFHPEAARSVRALGAGEQGMSWFGVGGNIGFALAPLVATPVLAGIGLAASPLLGIPALLGAACTALAARRGEPRTAAAAGQGTDDVRMFVRLAAMVITRSIVYMGLSSFVALYVRERTGGGAGAGAAALVVLFAGGAVGTVLGGRLAARWGRLRVVRAASLATVPLLAGLLLVPGPAMYVFVAAIAVALYLPFALQITLGQDYLPSRMGTASGVTLGLSVSIGGLCTPLLGTLADATSLGAALSVLLGVALVCLLLGRRLRDPKEDR